MLSAVKFLYSVHNRKKVGDKICTNQNISMYLVSLLFYVFKLSLGKIFILLDHKRKAVYISLMYTLFLPRYYNMHIIIQINLNLKKQKL